MTRKTVADDDAQLRPPAGMADVPGLRRMRIDPGTDGGQPQIPR